MLKVIGIGPGKAEWLPPEINSIIGHCEILIGWERALKLFPWFTGQQYCLTGDLKSGIAIIKDALREKKITGILVSGDPGFFSFLPLLQREFPDENIDVYPGISSLQFAFARAGVAWQDARFVSVHGRKLSVLPAALTRLTAVLTGGENTPQAVAKYYLELGINPKLSMGNALTYPEEVWKTTDAESLASDETPYQNAIVLLYPAQEQREWEKNYKIGIPDQEFLRGNVPMTKSEIRVQVLSAAQISRYDHVVDIGAGTGSISIEAANLASEGFVYAIECNPEAQELILANRQKFGISNLQLIPGTAPEAFSQLPQVDVCIIGGSNGRLPEILQCLPLINGGRVVITAVTVETLSQGLTQLKELDFQEIDIVSIQAVRWKSVKTLHMAQALNPVFILSARKGVTT
jgi:precorrin-6Y C5,15-methyltransferase (decarboxylating)